MPEFNETKQNARVAELHKKEEEELAQILSTKYDIQYIDLTKVSINTKALKLIPEEESRNALLAAFQINGKKLYVAVRSPNKKETQFALAQLEQKDYRVVPYIASTRSLERAWAYYSEIGHEVREKAGIVDISDEEIALVAKNMHNIDDVRSAVQKTITNEDALTSDIFEVLLAGGIALVSSDIHIEPENESVRVRIRLDGVLQDLVNIDATTYKLLLSRIKLVSGLKLNVRQAAQDGRFTIITDKSDVEVRASVIPSSLGETVVLRILDPYLIKTSTVDLGIDEHLLPIIRKEIRKPNGMILTTGPTGSGKTTTLYAFLNEIYNPGVKVMTIENPIEYRLKGIVQTQVDEKKGYSFFTGLRSALRQDPDVIMVGEIRDPETARTAINAALTGHIVFSTLHTNNAAGTIPRLIDLGVNPKIISSALNLTLAQRLIRILCNVCKKEDVQNEEERKIVNAVISGIRGREVTNHGKLWRPVGCSECNNTGYKGRTGVYEGILINKEIEPVIAKKPSENELWAAAKSQNMITMKEDGILRVLRGQTSLEEISRAVGLAEYMDFS